MPDLDGLADLPLVSFATGEKIIAAGPCPQKLFFLKSGRVEVVRDGTRIALVKTPGAVLGELSLLLGIDTTADVVALEDCELHVAEEPMHFLKSYPTVCLQVAKTLAYRLNAASQYLVDVKEQLQGYSDHVGMVDGVLDAILNRDLKKRV